MFGRDTCRVPQVKVRVFSGVGAPLTPSLPWAPPVLAPSAKLLEQGTAKFGLVLMLAFSTGGYSPPISVCLFVMALCMDAVDRLLRMW